VCVVCCGLNHTDPPVGLCAIQSQLRINVECSFGMLVNRWGILWQPMRCDLRKVPRVVLACMKLHNFIIDTGCVEIPAAIVHEQPGCGTKALPLHERPRLFSPHPATLLNVMSGRRNKTVKVHSTSTRDFLLDHVSSSGFQRPALSRRRRSE
jgi:hypothetical protein